MSYFKAIKDEMIVDVYDHLEFIRYDEKAKKVLRCSESDTPHGIIQRNGKKNYHVEGWPELPGEYETVSLVEFFDSNRYDEILAELDKNDEIEDTEDIFEEDKDQVEGHEKNQYVKRIEALEAITNTMLEVLTNG